MRLRRELANEEHDKRELGKEFQNKLTSVQGEMAAQKQKIDEATLVWSRHLNASVVEINRLNTQIATERGASLKNLITQLTYSTSDKAFLLKVLTDLNNKLASWQVFIFNKIITI